MGSTGESVPKKRTCRWSMELVGAQDLRLFTQQGQGIAISGKRAQEDIYYLRATILTLCALWWVEPHSQGMNTQG